MSFRPDLLAQIEHRLHHELHGCTLHHGQLLTITLRIPPMRLQYPPDLPGPWFFQGWPAQDAYLLGDGIAHRLSTSGGNRLGEMASTFRQVIHCWERVDPDNTGMEPAAFAGFAFAADDPMEGIWRGLPNTGLFFPELLLGCRRDTSVLSFTVCPQQTSADKAGVLHRWLARLERLFQALDKPADQSGPKTPLAQIISLPDEGQWLELVNQAIAAIGAGQFDKIVPARRLRVQAGHRLAPARLLAILNLFYPTCTLLALRLGERFFATATPERLVRREGSSITCDAVGGTMPRADDETEDQRYEQTMLHDTKLRREHLLVVESISTALDPLCEKIEIPPLPELIQLRNLQHLWTRIRGRLKPGVSLLDIAAHLHPTAAVNGVPAAEAQQWLNEHEHSPRGWYTGAAGWLDAAGDGELAVLLRCALLDGNRAELFAGAGITAESEPLTELQETRLKLGAMLEALENA